MKPKNVLVFLVTFLSVIAVHDFYYNWRSWLGLHSYPSPRISRLRNLAACLETYRIQYGNFPPTLDDLVRESGGDLNPKTDWKHYFGYTLQTPYFIIYERRSSMRDGKPWVITRDFSIVRLSTALHCPHF